MSLGIMLMDGDAPSDYAIAKTRGAITLPYYKPAILDYPVDGIPIGPDVLKPKQWIDDGTDVFISHRDPRTGEIYETGVPIDVQQPPQKTSPDPAPNTPNPGQPGGDFIDTRPSSERDAPRRAQTSQPQPDYKPLLLAGAVIAGLFLLK